MKKKLLLFALGLFALAGNTMAKSDIYYKVDKVDIMQGKKAAITFYYDADADAIFKGFQVEFVLPQGFHQATGHKLGAELAAHNPELQLRSSTRNDTNLYGLWENGDSIFSEVFMGFQIDLTEFPVGKDIELFTCYISCDEDVELGEYPFITTHLELADMKTGQSYHCDPKLMTLNVIEYAPRVISELDTEIAEASTEPEEILVKRTIKANTWSTLTLPFDLSGEQVAEIFGDDVQIAEFTDFEKEDVEKQKTWKDKETGEILKSEDVIVTYWTINFDSDDPADGLFANYPYIIKTSKDIDQFLVKGVEVDPNEDEAYIAYDNGRPSTHPRYELYAKMIGTLYAGETIPENGIYLSDNMFSVSNGSTTIKGLRAYITINGFSFKSGSTWEERWEDEGANICFSVDGEATAIEGVYVNGTEIANGDVYSVNGTFMGRAENVMNKLPRGIYIVNNKKVVVK